MPNDSLAARILAFVRDAETGTFEDLALAQFERQFGRLPAYREFCESQGVSPATLTSWEEIPAAELRPSDSFLADSVLTTAVLRSALPEFFEPNRLHLVHGSEQAPAAGSWILEALGREAAAESLVSGGRLDAKQLRSWLGARQRDRKPVSLASDLSGFTALARVLERRAVKFRLPPGSEALCVVSFEDTVADPERPGPDPSWKQPLLALLGLAPEVCRWVLGGPHGSTPLREEIALSASGFRLPHWVRATSSGAGTGAVAILDLASLEAPARRLVRAPGLVLLNADPALS